MLIDCATCPAAGHHCGSCIVSAFIDSSSVAPLDRREAAAVQLFADLGMISGAEAAQAHAVREPLELTRRVG
ncbi:MAG: hypothetical protein Q4G51_12920 [Dermatophilus congolensis]|nr:hypothetical protein [Dermatophilus congolensis]